MSTCSQSNTLLHPPVELGLGVVVNAVHGARREHHHVAGAHGEALAVAEGHALARQHKEQLVRGLVDVQRRVVAGLKDLSVVERGGSGAGAGWARAGTNSHASRVAG